MSYTTKQQQAVLRCLEQRIRGVHAKEVALGSGKFLSHILKAERRKADRVMVAHRVNQARPHMAVGRSLRNEQRISHLGVGITDLTEILHIDIRRDDVDGRRRKLPHLHHSRHRASGGIFSGLLALVQPAVCRHGQIVDRFSGLRYSVHIGGHMIGGKE